MLRDCTRCGEPLFEWMDRCGRCQAGNPWFSQPDDPFNLARPPSGPGHSDLHTEKLLFMSGVGGVLFAVLAAVGSLPQASTPLLSRVGLLVSAGCAVIGSVSLFLFHRVDVAALTPARRRGLRAWLVLAVMALSAVLTLLRRA